MIRPIAFLAAAALLATGCSQDGGGRTIVASIYPLAFAAERIAGPGWEVIDLTPPGVEAHDLELTLEQRAAVEEADIVLYMGQIGFQPQVEQAAAEAAGQVVAVPNIRPLAAPGAPLDPHFWLSPALMQTIALDLQLVISRASDPDDEAFDQGQDLFMEVGALGDQYAHALGNCALNTLIVTHEAFGYLIGPFEFEQFGLSGPTPEAEPSLERLARAARLIEGGKAGAVFYEQEGRATAQAFAEEAEVPALPLSTLESQPTEGDYFTVMEDNLDSLREGLQCR